jgi:radical SAM-linked protein
MGETTFRLRITYGKTGRLRYLSHLEIVHACERSVRRSQLAYAVTKGFSPHMKVAFGPALPVGTAGLAESFDVWLTAFVPPAEALERLTAVTPEGLAPVEARYVSEREPSLTAALTLADYQVVVRGPGMGPGQMKAGLEAIAADKTLEIEHKGKTKVFDLAAMLPKEPVVRETPGGVEIDIVTRMGASGSLRPEALVGSALRRSSVHDAVISVTRVRLRSEGADA